MANGWHLAITIALGLVLGSFANVLVARLPSGRSIVRPRSSCLSCKRKLPWYENIPLASYAALRGRCRGCHARISPRYPVIEAITALLFVAVAAREGWDPVVLLARAFPFAVILVAITFIDLEHRIIPDELSLGGLALGLATSWLTPDPGWVLSIGGAALGFGVFYGFARLYGAATGRAGLGGGDVKLLAMLGAFVGPEGVFWTILLSSVLGSVVGIGWALATRQEKLLRTAIPYGPFLVLGALIYYLYGRYLWLRFTIPM